MMKQFERDAVNKIVEFFRSTYKVEIIQQRIHLWNSNLKKQLPSIPLQPDIDILSYDKETKELIGTEAKVIYLTKQEKLNRKYYEGLDQAIALQMFGFDKVYFLQLFLVPSKPKGQMDKILDTFLIYSQHIKEIIENSNLSIGYTPCLDILWENKLTQEPVRVLDVSNSNSLLLSPKTNPFLELKLDKIRIIREYLLNKYVESDR